jgi:hypothetical protein
MTDSELLAHINALVNEEHALENQPNHTDDDRARLEQLQVALDQTWDLLRQRRARREFGENPDGAQERPENVVEGYKQ